MLARILPFFAALAPLRVALRRVFRRPPLDAAGGDASQRSQGLSRLTARRLMVPRREIVAVPHDVSLDQLIAVFRSRPYSRYPVFEGSLDNVVGLISAKQVVAAIADADAGFTIRDHMSGPLFVPETHRADHLVVDMRAQRSEIAIVLDEYGQTAGLVTLQDALARLVLDLGELPHEWESEWGAVEPGLTWLPDGSARLDGHVHLAALEEQLGMRFEESDVETIGGVLFGRLGRRPLVGDTVTVGSWRFVVDEVDGLRIAGVRVAPSDPLTLRVSDP
jgi:CBS domain containing-hemolysin-like protein